MFNKLFGKKAAEQRQPVDPMVEAEQQYQTLKAERGPSDPDTLQALFAYGQALNGRRHFEQAEQAGRELLTTFETEFGPDHPNVGYGLDVMATALAGQERREEALTHRKRSVELLQNHFGHNHEMTLQRARILAVDLVEAGQVDEAQKTLDTYMPSAMEIPPLYADYMDTSAFVAQAANGPEAAIPILEALIDFFRQHQQDSTAQYASKLFNLSQVYLQADRKLDALNASSEAGMVALETYGPDHPAAQDIFRFQTDLREASERGEF
ncbi:tetratricopeptide repeat protein [uncultured Litoreibacter sp.]|uniref:tetratricopeptide repeat protein n=1 Tax=uncultured Litoreibacter sp. TaxID=1392394 RepID=UPI002620451C|nr:tetratricopeptide repeat protein [uncultured Litoreibacter sp.]